MHLSVYLSSQVLDNSTSKKVDRELRAAPQRNGLGLRDEQRENRFKTPRPCKKNRKIVEELLFVHDHDRRA